MNRNNTLDKLPDNIPSTLEKDFLELFPVSDKVNNILNLNSIPSWASSDSLIQKMVESNIWNFITCQEVSDENIDKFKPKFHRWYIYFDWEKYYIKRWKLKYISWVPFRSKWFSAEEYFIIWKNNYQDLLNFINSCLLSEDYIYQ